MGPPESTIQKAPWTGSAVLVVTDGCDRQTYVFGDGIRASGGGSNKQMVPGPSQIQTPKGISFGLSVLAQLVVVTDRQLRSLASIEATAAAAAAAAAQS